MLDTVVANEATVRFSAFIVFLSVVAVLELVSPRRPLTQGRGMRWMTNLALLVTGTLALRLLAPILAVGAAAWAAERNIGLLALWDVPLWLHVVVGFLLLDFAIYAQHVAMHHVPVLWRMHAVHHTDRDMDLTTALRFHPAEILLSMAYKVAVVIALGVDPAVVILFEVVLNASAMIHHGNFRIPHWLDRILRHVVVTPDMHRVHHSVDRRETDSNFGFFLTIWDRLFRTYNAEPAAGHLAMTLGLEAYQGKEPARFAWTLGLPFARSFNRPDRS